MNSYVAVDQELRRLIHKVDILSHVIIEAGIEFDEDWPCDCVACKEVENEMREAGYIE